MVSPSRIKVLDSHTAGEPTRLVLEGGPDLGSGPLEDRLGRLRGDLDSYRSAIANEPRGSDTMVGAFLCEPHRNDCQFGVIFFNNVGYLGMCAHGTIGVVASLAHLGRLATGKTRIDTPVGPVDAELHPNGEVSVHNVPSQRRAHAIPLEVPGYGTFRVDIAWGGNWFCLVDHCPIPIERANAESLTALAWEIRKVLNAQGHPHVDHVELFGASPTGADSRNFVLCPGKAYDRSPCGTGTSGKMACLAADGKLAEGQDWIQEGVLGSHFRGRYRWIDRKEGIIAPTIVGKAYITGELTLILDPEDPFCWGLR